MKETARSTAAPGPALTGRVAAQAAYMGHAKEVDDESQDGSDGGATAAVLAGGGTAYGDGSPVCGRGGRRWPGLHAGGAAHVARPHFDDGTAVAQIASADGEVNGYVALRGRGLGFSRVAFDGTTAGISAGGRTLVLVYRWPPFSRDAASSPS